MQSIRGWERVRVRQEVETEIELPKLWEKIQIKMLLFGPLSSETSRTRL